MLTDIISTLGDNMGGFVELKVCPIEWLAADIIADGVTGTVRQPVALLPGKALITIKCQTDTIDLKEKPKNSNSGDYYEVAITGIINLDEPAKSTVLEKIRYHKLAVMCPDKNGRTKIYGNINYGMKLETELQVDGDAEGKSSYDLSLTIEQEHKGLFYEP